MDTFNGRYIIHRIQSVEIGQGGIGVDDFLDDIDIDNDDGDGDLTSPIPPLFRMQGATVSYIGDQFGYLDESGPAENPHNLYNFSFLFDLNNNDHLNLTRLNFDLSTLSFTTSEFFTTGNNPIAFDENTFTFDSNGNPTNMGFNLSLKRYNDCMVAISNGPSSAVIDGDAYNIAGVLAPASDLETPVRVQEFAAGAFYPSSVTADNFGTGGENNLFSL